MKFLTFVLLVLFCFKVNGQVIVMNSASGQISDKVAPDSWVTIYGSNLPYNFKIKDSSGEKTLKVGYHSPTQANLLIPTDTQVGHAELLVGDFKKDLEIVPVSAGIFTFTGNGLGIPAANLLRVRGSALYYEYIAGYNPDTQAWFCLPIKWNTGADRVFLILYGTGLRHRYNLSDIRVTIGDVDCQVSYGGHGSLEGLDQINVEIPRILENTGKNKVKVFINNKPTNETYIEIQ